MKLSTEIASSRKIVGDEKAIELIARAGFNGWDFSMSDMWQYNWGTREFDYNEASPLAKSNYLEYARLLRKIGEDNGIVCNQSHAPFPSHVDLFDKAEPFFKRAIECTAEAGGKICIIHPDSLATAEQNAEFYSKLLPFAHECGVKIATENMWCWDEKENHALFAACATAVDFKRHIDAVNDDYLVACLDIGHAEMMGDMVSATELVKALGSSLQALHIHDNDCRYDRHTIPYSMNIDLDSVADALREVGYNGWFTLEADAYLKSFDESKVFEGVCNLYSAAERFEKRFLGE